MLDTEFWIDSFLSAIKICCFTSFWPPWFLMTKSVIQIVVSQSVTCFLWLLLRFKKFFFGLYFQQFGYDASGRGLPCLYPIWSSLRPLPQFCGFVFCQIWDIFSHYLFQNIFSITFFSSPSETPVTQMWDFLVFSHMSLRICPFFSNLFSLYYSDWIISIDIKFTVFSAISILILSLSS